MTASVQRTDTIPLESSENSTSTAPASSSSAESLNSNHLHLATKMSEEPTILILDLGAQKLRRRPCDGFLNS